MGRVVPPDSVDWPGLFGRFEHTCFRLETLQRYEEPGESGALRSFLAGQEPAVYPGMEAWLAIVRGAVAAGKVMQRVHVVSEPLTDYLRFEIGWSYQLTAAMGEDIRISRAAAALPSTDYWLFDSRALARMHYDGDGRLASVELDNNPAAAVQAGYWRDVALHIAVPLASWRPLASLPEHG
jgi:hypothetical protein